MTENGESRIRALEDVVAGSQEAKAFENGCTEILRELEFVLTNHGNEGLVEGLSERSDSQSSSRRHSGDLRRRGSIREGSGGRHSVDQNVTAPRKQIQEEKVNDNSGAETGGLFGSSPPFEVNFDKIGGGSVKRKRFIAIGAYILVYLGLLTSLVLITIDFISGFREVPNTVRFDRVSSISMPELYVCNPSMVLPWQYKNVGENALYPGTPLLWVEKIRNGSEGSLVTYPDTHNMAHIDTVRVDATGKHCKESLVGMNPREFEERAFAKDSTDLCFTCMRLQKDNRVMIESVTDEASNRSNTALFALQIGQHRFLDACQFVGMGLPIRVRENFKALIKQYAKQLEEAGILNFGGLNPEQGADSDVLFPDIKRGADFFLHDVTDMYCNTFFFSGYFYPSTTTGILFRFNPNASKWERSGSGRYFPESFSSYKLGLSQDTSLSPGATQSKIVERAEIAKIHIYTTMGGRNAFTELAIGSLLHETSVFFTKEEINGEPVYSASKVKDFSALPVSVTGTTQFYDLKFGIDTFLVKTVSRQRTVSWTAYSADVFGLYVAKYPGQSRRT